MSPLIRRTFFALRDLNARKIVPYTRRSFEAKQLPIATKKIVEIFSQALIKTGVAKKAIPSQDEENNELDESYKVERDKIEQSGDKLSYERKMIHYYDRISTEKLNEIYYNSLEAIRDIAKRDLTIALGEEKYDGELKEYYEIEKIMPIKTKIGELGKTSEMLTDSDKKQILEELISERMKNIEKIVASKMAIEYIGGMTDNTIISVLLSKNIVSVNQIVQGYGRKMPGEQQVDNGVVNLQKAFSQYETMIWPDDAKEEDIRL